MLEAELAVPAEVVQVLWTSMPPPALPVAPAVPAPAGHHPCLCWHHNQGLPTSAWLELAKLVAKVEHLHSLQSTSMLVVQPTLRPKLRPTVLRGARNLCWDGIPSQDGPAADEILMRAHLLDSVTLGSRRHCLRSWPGARNMADKDTNSVSTPVNISHPCAWLPAYDEFSAKESGLWVARFGFEPMGCLTRRTYSSIQC